MVKPTRRVLMLGTGGTLGMRARDDGSLAPDDLLCNLMNWIPEMAEYANLSMEMLCNIDSSQMTPEIWLKIARRIREAQTKNECTGVVILHGTDTLAYTASALSFLIPDLKIPVVLTGGQRSLAVIRTDARNNVLGAIETALEGPAEVMVFFHNMAFRGNRVMKDSVGRYHAFESPNYPALGEAGIQWQWNKNLFWPATRRPTIWSELPQSLPSAPWVLPWVPGLDFSILEGVLEKQWAVIIEAFGTGNMPFTETMRNTLRTYMDKDGLVFLRSQVRQGATSIGAYASGKEFQALGIHGGGDMTREAMTTKLMVLRGLGLDNQTLISRMTHSLVGELTE